MAHRAGRRDVNLIRCGTGSFLDTATENSKDNDVLSIKAAKRKDLADALEKVAEVRAFEIKDASNKAMRKKNVW